MQAREAEKKLQQLAQFTRDMTFTNVQKSYDQQIADQREKFLRGVQRKGQDPLGELAMSKEMMRCAFFSVFVFFLSVGFSFNGDDCAVRFLALRC